MKKVFGLFLSLFIFSFAFLPKAHAQSNVTTSYNVNYSVNPSGTTHVVFSVGLKNTSSDYYVSSYSVQVGFTDVTNATASDGRTIVPQVKKNADGYLITLHFNKQVVGLNNVLRFTLAFDTVSVAQKTGQIWELNIPGIGKQGNFSDFNVHINVPPSFGTAAFIKPPQFADKLDFTKQQLEDSGISITFGKRQVYSFDLAYHLQNKNLFPIQTEIALPPTTNYQDIAIESIDPLPSNVTRDKDGNWLAQYLLLPSKKIDVQVKGRSFLSLTPKAEALTQKDIVTYLQPQPYWQVKDTTIQQLAKQLQTPENIYNYVRTHLTYDFSRVTVDQKRLGAAAVVLNPKSAVCLEFTDLFIAIARAAGIPARAMDGFGYTQNTKERPLLNDILHAWPEYYDTNTQSWVMVDPTWGNTTDGVDYFHILDFDHFTFTIRGVNSSYPVPAGGYKLPGHENVKDVAVGFTDDTTLPDPKIALSDDLPKQAIAGLPLQTNVVITNAGQTMSPQQSIMVTTKGLSPEHQEVIVPAIPPYGHVSVPLRFASPSFLTKDQSTVTIQVGSASLSKTIAIVPVYENPIILLGGGIVGILIVIIYIIAARSRRVSISR